MSSSISILISAKDDASKAIKRVSDSLDDGSGAASRYGAALKDMGAKAATALGLAATAAGTFAVKLAADYEQSLNVFRSVSSATAEQMAQVADKAKQLGNDIALPGVSAKDAALSMVELAKAGLSVNDTLAASKGVLSLAKAGQLETAAAAEIAANALNAFSLKGSEASRVADLLAAAANASSADVQDMAYALQMSSASAAAVKVPVEDLTTAIAAMANNGIKGSDAGTSLKTMFMNLIPTTKRAKQSMRELGLDFYDAKGNFVGLRDLVAQLQEGTRKLTDEQKAQHIENIFGSDSMRAANILMKEGTEGYDKLAVAVGKQGAAQELAAAQNAGFNGALDNLISTLETAAIDIGTRALPTLTEGLKMVAGWASALSSGFLDLVDRSLPKLKELAKQVGDYLAPKFAALRDVITSKLLPALHDLWKRAIEPLVPVVGVLLVASFGLLLDIITPVIGLVADFTQALMDGNPWIVTVVGALAGLKGALMLQAAFTAITGAFQALTLTTIPGAVVAFKGLAALIATPLAMPAIAVGAAIASLVAVYDQAQKTLRAIDEANASKHFAEESDAQLAQTLYELRRNGTPQQKANAEKIGKARGIPGFALGTGAAPGGLALVGERGPELVNLPRGSAVTPAYRTRAGADTGSTTNNYLTGTFNFGSKEAVDEFFSRLDKTGRLARMGLA